MTVYGILWLVAMIAFVVIECISYQLMSIWMAVGAGAGLIAYFVGADFLVQFVVFIVVSIALIALTRPFASKFLNSKNEKTNIDNLLGKKGIVIKRIDNIKGTGTIKLGGIEWSARAEDTNEIEEDEIVEVVRIEGVKAIVRKEN